MKKLQSEVDFLKEKLSTRSDNLEVLKYLQNIDRKISKKKTGTKNVHVSEEENGRRYERHVDIIQEYVHDESEEQEFIDKELYVGQNELEEEDNEKGDEDDEEELEDEDDELENEDDEEEIEDENDDDDDDDDDEEEKEMEETSLRVNFLKIFFSIKPSI